MSGSPDIDAQFLEPLETALISLETGQIPILVFSSDSLGRFATQTSTVLNATYIYLSQKDFVSQFRHSLESGDTLLVSIDIVLEGDRNQLIDAYLAWRDVLGADPSPLDKLGITRRAAGHRLMLLIQRQIFDAHADGIRHRLIELCDVCNVE